MRPDAGWTALPTATAPRWWLPSRPRGGARAALAVYQPVTAKGRLGWRAARIAAGFGVLRLLPTAAPPRLVRDAVAAHVPAGGQYAVMGANHLHRFVVLVVDRRGQPTVVAKVALSTDGQHALQREASALATLGRRLPAPLRAPEVVTHEPEILVTRAVAWQVRRTPWKLPAEVASALGAWFGAAGNGGSGAGHGDCAPWNLLSSGGSWVLVDWERATATAPPFLDLVHYLVQSHVLLGRPRVDAILAGLGGRGWVGAAIHAYAGAAGLPAGEAIDRLLGYLRGEPARDGADTAPRGPAPDARRRLLSAVERWAARCSLRSATAP